MHLPTKMILCSRSDVCVNSTLTILALHDSTSIDDGSESDVCFAQPKVNVVRSVCATTATTHCQDKPSSYCACGGNNKLQNSLLLATLVASGKLNFCGMMTHMPESARAVVQCCLDPKISRGQSAPETTSFTSLTRERWLSAAGWIRRSPEVRSFPR